MLFDVDTNTDFSVYALRRKDLLSLIKERHPQVRNGCILISAAFENNRTAFRQDNSFFYLTGIEEPGAVLLLDITGKSVVYIPHFSNNRDQWVASEHAVTRDRASHFALDAIEFLGQPCSGYQLYPCGPQSVYTHLLNALESIVKNDGTLFVLNPSSCMGYEEQKFFLLGLKELMPTILHSALDISNEIAFMRRTKDMREIELLYRAVEITQLAHEAAAQAIKHNVTEAEIQASLEYIMTAAQAYPAFPSIVASGNNATILHYHKNTGTMKNGDLVVVDIGAEYSYYCADVTRTYPISGAFTKRQYELYNHVLETQEYIADIASPGYWLSNKEYPEKSLHHLAVQFLAKRGLDRYFVHGIGHFLGMQVHDVGDICQPLKEGDIITIEPGIYIPEEGIGIRIEDNYWLVKDGVVCLSEQLPKKPDDIEKLMLGVFEDEEEEDILEDNDAENLEEEEMGFNGDAEYTVEH